MLPSTSFTVTILTLRSFPGIINLNLRENPFFAGAGTLLTIHNLAHQGIYPKESLAYAGIDPAHYLPDVSLSNTGERSIS